MHRGFFVPLLVATPAWAEVCDKLTDRSLPEGLLLTAGPFVACVVATLLVHRGSTSAAAAATILSGMGLWSMREAWPLVQLAQAEPCGPAMLRDGIIAIAGLILLFAVPNGLWTIRRVKAARGA
jgi:hypothetical protein